MLLAFLLVCGQGLPVLADNNPPAVALVAASETMPQADSVSQNQNTDSQTKNQQTKAQAPKGVVDSIPSNLDNSNLDQTQNLNPAASSQDSTAGANTPKTSLKTKPSPGKVGNFLTTNGTAQPGSYQVPVGTFNPAGLTHVDLTSGALVSDYAVEAPPGRNGLEPSLKLSHNSQQKDNLSAFGFGWSINIPYIERQNRAGVDKLYSANPSDWFFNSSLSGELTLASTNASSSIFSYIARSDNGDFLNYSFNGSSWTVTDKQGKTYKFGADPSGRLDNPQNSSQVFRWMLQEVRDTNNNYISYQYFKDQGQIYPSQIIYTGNGTTDGPFSLNFSRESRPDFMTNFSSGFSVTSAYRINQIQALASGNMLFQYDLAYGLGSNGNRSILQSITKSGKDNNNLVTALPPEQFAVQNNPVNQNPSSGGFGLPADVIPSFADFVDVNGDGITDIVNSFAPVNGTNINEVYLSNGRGTWTISPTYVPPMTFYNQGGSSIVPHFFADVNGDGLNDLITTGPVVSCRGTQLCVPLVAYLNTGSNWNTKAGWVLPYPDNVSSGLFMSPGFLTDINGDGLPDILTQEGQAYLNNGSGWNSPIAWNVPVLPPNQLFAGQEAILGDINGDGIMDEMVSYRRDYFANGRNGDIISTTVMQTWLGAGNSTFVLNNNYVPPTLFQNDFSEVWGCTPPSVCDYDLGVRLIDINGDGLPDLVQSADDLSQNPADLHQLSSVFRVYMNTGNGWSAPYTFFNSLPPPFDQGYGSAGHNNAFGDFDGDGNTDILANFNQNTNSASIYTFAQSPIPTDAIVSVTYPTGGTAAIQYKPSPSFVGSQSNLLNPKLPFSTQVVSQISINDQNGNTVTQNYSYSGGSYYFNNPFDRKFAGFAQIDSADAAGNVSKNYYHTATGSDGTRGEFQDNYFKIGKAYRAESYNNSQLYKLVINKWDSSNLAGNAGFVKLAQTTEQDFDGQASHKDKAESYTYDPTNGNLTQKIEWGQVNGNNDGSFVDAGSDKFTTTTAYAGGGNLGVIANPSDVIVADQNSNKVKESQYFYDNLPLGAVALGNLTKQADWISGSAYSTLQKTCNGFGLVATQTDPRGKITNYSYDPLNLYPASITNPLNQLTQYTYNYANGKISQTTTANNRVFKNIYDGLGRLLEQDQPDLSSPASLVPKTTYVYTDTPGAVSVRQSNYLDAATVADSYTYFDGLGRKLQERKANKVSEFDAVDYVYNNLGLLAKVSLPYASAGTTKTSPTQTANLYANYTYDPLQRVSASTNAVGSVLTAYSPWQTTVTDFNGKPKDLFYDAYGNLNQVTEHNAGNAYNTNYSYNYLGNLLAMTDALGNVRNFGYDGLGRRLNAQDLHASADSSFGTWIYAYDNAGNLVSRIDPKNQTTNYAYDDLNRLLSEDFTGQSGIEVSNTYDSGLDGIGQLTGQNSSALNQTDSYNALGLVAAETRTLGGSNYTTSYSYDRQGNKILVTEPDNSQIKYIYNSAGLLDQVLRKESSNSDFTPLVSSFSYSPTGQVAAIAYANGAATANTYDANQLYRLSHKVSSLPAGTNTQDISYAYDPNSNIIQMVDASATNAAKTVNFVYDDLSRLASQTTTAAVNGNNHSETYAYDALGNLTNKSDQGAYTYSGAGFTNPDAVTSVAVNNFSYDNNGNLLSAGPQTYAWDYNNRLVQSSSAATSTITVGSMSFFPTAGDGYVYNDGSSWSTTRSATAGTAANSTATTLDVSSGQSSKRNYRIERAFLPFDTSALPDNATITGVNLKVFVSAKLDNDSDGKDWVSVVQGSQANANSLATGDFDMAGSINNPVEGVDAPGRLSIASTTPGQYVIFTLNPTGRGWVSKTGNTKLALREGHDVLNVPFVGSSGQFDQLQIATSEFTATSSDPVLTVTYSVTSTSTPPAFTYAYDPSGERVKSTNASGTTYYPSKDYNVTGNLPTKHIFANGELLASVTGSGASSTVYTILTDHLTGSNVVTTASGTIAEVMDYYPFGASRLDEQPAGFSEQRKYIGQEYDASTGLNYLNDRYYNSQVGRFYSQDSLFLALGNSSEIKQFTSKDMTQFLADPQELNSYSYSRNNPVTLSDPSGHCIWDGCLLEIGAAVGALASYIFNPKIANAPAPGETTYSSPSDLTSAGNTILDSYLGAISFGALSFDKEIGSRPLSSFVASEDQSATAIFGDEAEQIIPVANNIKSLQGYYDVISHGEENSLAVSLNGKWTNFEAKSLATFLQKGSNFYNGQAVRVIACQTGSCATGFGQNLANELKVNVLAPNDVVYLHDSGALTVGSENSNTGQWVQFTPQGK